LYKRGEGKSEKWWGRNKEKKTEGEGAERGQLGFGTVKGGLKKKIRRKYTARVTG